MWLITYMHSNPEQMSPKSEIVCLDQEFVLFGPPTNTYKKAFPSSSCQEQAPI